MGHSAGRRLGLRRHRAPRSNLGVLTAPQTIEDMVEKPERLVCATSGRRGRSAAPGELLAVGVQLPDVATERAGQVVPLGGACLCAQRVGDKQESNTGEE